MAWADDVFDGVTEALSDAGVQIEWNGVMLTALQGSGQSFDQLADGGYIGSENPSFTVLKAQIDLLSPGQTFAQGDEILFAGKTLYIKSISFDVADPDIRILTQGEGQ